MNTTVVMRKRGVVVLPVKLREKYDLEEGTPFTLIDLGDGTIILSPKVSRVPELVAEFGRLTDEAGVTLEELLEGLQEERKRYTQEKYGSE
ncbi:MAG: AbrB/MazE/SpoVT family DNA-binding domain-containing protein [Anaerolineae bacterium]|nr:AbrB/MazE/SpoVT family DNA-binding domain-containing protein [Anaerolineae bacterium]